jgi:squalene-associated FAD-dependent desaturase
VAFERVAVIGAGLAGLAAAVQLKELGAHVELFERSRLLGGRATSFEIDGIEVDNGQHVFLACCTEFMEFARRAGFADRLKLQPRFEALVLARDGKQGRLRAANVPAPFHLLASFASYAHLSLGAKLRIARALASAMFRRSDEATTFESWLILRHQDAETRRAFWDPFFIPALNAPFDQVSLEDAMFTLKTAFLADPGASRFGFATVPLAHLAAAAAEELDAVHLSTAVLGIESQNSHVTLRLQNDVTKTFDAVVLAVPPRAVAKLLGDPQRFGLTDLDGYRPFPILDVHLWHDQANIGFDFAAALESPLQWIFEKAPGYLSCSFSAADEYMRLSTNELETLAWSEVQTYVPSMKSATLIRSAVTRNPEATWLPKPNVKRAPQKTNDPRVAIAGSWTETGWPDTMESAVRSGNLAAAFFKKEAPTVILSVASETSVVEGPQANAPSVARAASEVEVPTR